MRARDVSEASIASSVGGTSPFEVSRSRSVASERSLSGARGRRSTSRSLPRSPTTVRRELRRKIQRERAEPLTVSPVSPPIDLVVETESDYARYLASTGALADEPSGMTPEEYQRKRREIRASELGVDEPSDVEPMTTDTEGGHEEYKTYLADRSQRSSILDQLADTTTIDPITGQPFPSSAPVEFVPPAPDEPAVVLSPRSKRKRAPEPDTEDLVPYPEYEPSEYHKLKTKYGW